MAPGIGIGISPMFGQSQSWSRYWAARYPSLLSILITGSDTCTLSWINNGDIDYNGVVIYYSTDGLDFVIKDIIEAGHDTFDVTTLTADTEYYFKIRYYRGEVWDDGESWSDFSEWEESAVIRYSDYSNTVNDTTWMAEYDVVYSSFTNKPDSSTIAKQNAFVKALVDGGVWSDLDVLYNYAIHTNNGGEALINWKNPTLYAASLVNSGDVSFIAGVGFLSGGLNGYINNGWNPSLHGVNYTQNNAMIGVYSHDKGIAGTFDAGMADATNLALISFALGTVFDRVYLNSDSYTTIATPVDESGLKVHERINASGLATYLNNVKYGGGRASTGVPNASLFSLTNNANGTPATPTQRRMGMIFAGKSLGDAKNTILYNAITTYLS